ncbi:MAG: glycosyltransferase [Pirellulaceae bacterium]
MTIQRPTICQLLHSLTVGGAEVLAARLARRLKERYHFVFACLDDLGTLGQELCDEGFPVEVFHRRPGVDLRCSAQLARWWYAEGVELVHAHQYTPFFYAMTARRLRRAPPVLFTEHGRWFPDSPSRKRIIFNRLMLRRADRVVGVGESVRQALIQNEGIPANRVGVIYNGVDARHFQENGETASVIREEIGVTSDDFVILQVARLDHLKDHLTAIRTAARVAQECPRARLVLVGEGPEREVIEAEVRKLRIEPHVILLGLRQDIARLLRAADVFLLTSISEGIPVTIIEAMAVGLPVVSTAVGGVPEVVVPDETGLLTASGDDVALADALLLLARDRQQRKQLGANGRRRAEHNFSEQKMHAAYEACYKEMLHG